MCFLVVVRLDLSRVDQKSTLAQKFRSLGTPGVAASHGNRAENGARFFFRARTWTILESFLLAALSRKSRNYLFGRQLLR